MKPVAIIRTGGAVIKFCESYSGSGFSAALTFKNGRLTLEVDPKQPMTFDELSVAGFAEVTESDRIFMNGYQSWTDSCELTVNDRMVGIDRIPAPIVKKYSFDKYGDYGFAHYSPKRGVFHGWTYAYIRSGDKFTLVGSLSERCGFTQIKLFTDRQRIKLSRECEGAVYSEPFRAVDCALISGSENEVFDRWQEMCGTALDAKKPAVLRGYTSWYRHYQDISQEKLSHDLSALTASDMPADIFQIDDGYQTAVGDWLSIDKSKFPRGIKPLADKIHKAGMMAGLWLAPFVCEKKSALFRDHPDWIMKDTDGKPLSAGCNWSGSYALDIYNEEVSDYLRRVFDTVLNEWGFDLVKLDFLYAACIRPCGGRSRGQMMCEAMDFLRELCGDKLILGCGVPLGAAFGKVDYCRIGCDVGLSWNDNLLMRLTHRERVSTRNSMLNTVFRRQLNGRFFRNDPDVFLLRDENISLHGFQKKSLALVNHLFGSVLFTSDDVSSYDEKRRKAARRSMRYIGAKVTYADFTGGVVKIKGICRGRDFSVSINMADGRIVK